MKDTYLKALDDARKELEGLMQERAQLDDRIVRLAKSIEGLAALCDDTDHSSELKNKLIELELSETMGLTDAIRQIIASSIFPITATAIRDALVAEGFDPNSYSNMLTVIHNTLLRLEKQGEIQRGANLFGMRGWRHKPVPSRAVAAEGGEGVPTEPPRQPGPPLPPGMRKGK